jgi:nucleotide-binding universal stress UspA family protein
MAECVLVATDLSPDADIALQYAITLGVEIQAHVVLIHVRDTAEWNPWAYAAGTESVTREILEHKLQQVVHAGLSGEVILAHGVPWQEIIDCGEAHQASLIVMGTHGRTGLRRFLLGSVAEKVLRHASCSVLVTRAPDALEARD